MKKRTLLLVIISLSAMLAAPGLYPLARPAMAQEAMLDGLRVWEADGEVRMYCRAVNCFTPEVIRTIQNGFTTTVAFDINMYRSRRFWFNEGIGKLNVEKTVKYLPAKEEYQIRAAAGGEVLLKDVDAVEKALFELPELTVARTDQLSPDVSYTLQVRASVWAATLPLFLDYLLLGATLVEVDTGWKEMELVFPLQSRPDANTERGQ